MLHSVWVVHAEKWNAFQRQVFDLGTIVV